MNSSYCIRNTGNSQNIFRATSIPYIEFRTSQSEVCKKMLYYLKDKLCRLSWRVYHKSVYLNSPKRTTSFSKFKEGSIFLFSVISPIFTTDSLIYYNFSFLYTESLKGFQTLENKHCNQLVVESAHSQLKVWFNMNCVRFKSTQKISYVLQMLQL